ncbi:hypothetical protein GCM10027026_39890 [Myroides odoratimimus subsp. xuanwuensis]
MLAPGVLLTRRDRHHLQVGLDPERRVVVADVPEVRGCLEALREGRHPDPHSHVAIACCRALLDAGLVVDGDALLSTLPSDPLRRRAVAALFTESGADAPRVLHRRATTWVRLQAPQPWRDEISRLLELAGLSVAPPRGRATAAPMAELLMTLGEPQRERLDAWHHDGRAHLLVALVEGQVRVGPFVLPGRTACLRCLDAHQRDRDSAHALVLEQYVAAREAAVPEPADPSLVSLAVAWAARDLLTWVDGGRPSTWSASVLVTPALHLEPQRWLRHPRCGCSWAEELAVG